MKIAGYLFIALGILDFLLSWIGVDITGFSLSPLIFETIGFLLVYTPIYLEKHKGKVAEFEGSLDEGETLLKSGDVTFKESFSKQENGALLLTDRRLFYRGTGKVEGSGDDIGMSYDVGSNDFELLLGDISSVEITKFPFYIIIKDKDNNEFRVGVGMRGKEEWKNEILKAVSGTD